MSDAISVEVVILWDEELRLAGKALSALLESQRAFDLKTASEDKVIEHQNKMHEALNAAWVALGQIGERPNAHLVVCTAKPQKVMPVYKKKGRP